LPSAEALSSERDRPTAQRVRARARQAAYLM
jgi:hypothetical protein